MFFFLEGILDADQPTQQPKIKMSRKKSVDLSPPGG